MCCYHRHIDAHGEADRRRESRCWLRMPQHCTELLLVCLSWQLFIPGQKKETNQQHRKVKQNKLGADEVMFLFSNPLRNGHTRVLPTLIFAVVATIAPIMRDKEINKKGKRGA